MVTPPIQDCGVLLPGPYRKNGPFHLTYATNRIVVAMNPDRTGSKRQPADTRRDDLDHFSCTLPFTVKLKDD
jgi:hypothetical protein